MKEQAIQIVTKLQNAGFQAVWAGGCVRDMLLGIEPHDYDIATSATPDQIESLFEHAHTIPVGKAFGVIIVVLDNVQYEVATFRTDGKYVDGRHPESVFFSGMEEDAKRRDLTINGMFYDPVSQVVRDFVQGQEDLKDKVIRLIGDPQKRIDEDKLRMMRVVRFASRFTDFDVSLMTHDVVRRNASYITQVSFERIFEEFLKILRLHNFQKSFALLSNTGLLQYILPEVESMKGCTQPVDYHPEGDVYLHTLIALENLPKDASDELLMGTLLHDIGKPVTWVMKDRIRFDGHDFEGSKITQQIMQRFKASNEFADHVIALVENHMKFMHVKEMRVSRLRRFMRLTKFNEHMNLHRSDCLASHGGLDNYEFMQQQVATVVIEPERLRPVRLVTGHDLIALGLQPGPEFRTILEALENQQLEGTITTREQALEFIKEKVQKVHVV